MKMNLNGLGGFVSNGTLYWYSTEHDDRATATDFSNGDQGWLCKQCGSFGLTKIRAVRYF